MTMYLRTRLSERLIVLVTLAALLATLLPAMATAQSAPAVAGRLAGSSTDPGDGIKVFVRWVNEDRFYAVHINRRDGGMRIQRKEGSTYYPLDLDPPAFAPNYDGRQQVEVTVTDQPDGSVDLELRIDGRVVHTATDAGDSGAGAPLRTDAHVGLRGDNTEFLLDNLDVHRAAADGRRGAALIEDPFDHPDGLITNQRIQSTQDPNWRVISGSLFADDGWAWSGVPDDVRPDPESRWSTNSSTFRMVSQRDDLRDVVVSFGLVNRGYVTPSVLPQIAAPAPAPYPTGTGSVAVTRLEGSNNVRTAIAASTRAFGTASDVVLTSTALEPAIVAAPALAGSVNGPLLLTSDNDLHPETAAELRRLRARTVHLVGQLGSGVGAALRDAGYQVRTYAGSTPEARTASVAREVGGSHLYLATTESFDDAIVVSGAAAATTTPVALTPADRLGDAAGQVIEANGVERITVIGNDLDPGVVAELRAAGLTVDHAGHSRYAIARSAAQVQDGAGGSPAQLWVTAGARPLHTLTSGPASAHSGDILLVVDGDDLGDTSLDDLGYEGYESRHWARVNRSRLSRLLPIGPTDGLTPRVVDQLRAEVVTVVAGMRDIAGNAHETSIVALLDANIAGGYGDGTYRPGQVVTRGQMATFLTNAFDLDPGSTDLTDVRGTSHERGIGAVVNAGIAGGYPDGTYRPDQAVTRGQMATFLTEALGLEPVSSDIPDTTRSTHNAAIGAVIEAEIAKGYADGTYRPGQAVTRAQMATFLVNALNDVSATEAP